MNRVEKIIQSIKDAGLTINKVEKTAGLDSGTIRRWDKNYPKIFTVEEKIHNVIKELSDENRCGL